jgi:hypothetical protein
VGSAKAFERRHSRRGSNRHTFVTPRLVRGVQRCRRFSMAEGRASIVATRPDGTLQAAESDRRGIHEGLGKLDAPPSRGMTRGVNES